MVRAHRRDAEGAESSLFWEGLRAQISTFDNHEARLQK